MDHFRSTNGVRIVDTIILAKLQTDINFSSNHLKKIKNLPYCEKGGHNSQEKSYARQPGEERLTFLEAKPQPIKEIYPNMIAHIMIVPYGCSSFAQRQKTNVDGLQSSKLPLACYADAKKKKLHRTQ